MPTLAIYTDLDWCLGIIHKNIAKKFRALGWAVHEISWDGKLSAEEREAIDASDAVLTLLGLPFARLRAEGVPAQKMFVVAHGESDLIAFLQSDYRAELDRVAGFGVVADSLVNSSLTLGFTRIPTVLRMGIHVDDYAIHPMPTKLEKVGYVAIASRANDYGVEIKRKNISVEICRRAGLQLVHPERVGIADVPKLYGLFDAYILSSLQEGSPYPPLEAAASGRILLGTPAGHMPRLALEHLGEVGPIGAEDFIAWASARLLHFKQEPGAVLQSVGQGAQNHARKHRDWSVVFEDWQKFVEAGLGRVQADPAAAPRMIRGARGKKTMHFVCPFHTVPSLSASHCAFTGKALRFPKMMRGYFDGGYYEYANEGSESVGVDEKVVILTREECAELYPRNDKDFWGNHANVQTKGYKLFNERLIDALASRVQDGDFIGHPFGRAHESLLDLFPEAIHVETGIGYPDSPSGAFRIFESWAWAHYHWGQWDHANVKIRDGHGQNRLYSWVVPNYYDVSEWKLGKGDGGYVLFAGRIDAGKGSLVLGTVIKAWFEKFPKSKLRFKFVGQGNFEEVRQHIGEKLCAEHVDYDGPIAGLERSRVYGAALCMAMPTGFIEPFGGSGVEGMLTGTPLVASAWGAFTETVIPGFNGYLVRTIGDWIDALERLTTKPAVERQKMRGDIRKHALSRYSLEACRAKYVRAFDALYELKFGQGAMGPLSTLQLVP